MTREFYPTISVACLQLRFYIVPFLPSECRLSQVYGRKLESRIEVKAGRDRTWSPCLRILDGHTADCNADAISPDGKHIASGSDDVTIGLWVPSTEWLLQV